MIDERVHHGVSGDGTKIVGTVHGHGPPLVFVHGAMDDGEVTWRPSLPHLTERFTCHVMSTRGRGRSDTSEDHRPCRLVDDVAAYTASVGEPVGLVGLSLGGMLALGAAARLGTVSAVAVYEPVVMEAMGEDEAARFLTAVAKQGEAAEDGRLDDAVRIFAELVGNDEELAALEARGAFETMARNVPADLAVISQSAQDEEARGTDPAVLSAIEAPLLLLQGGRCGFSSWFHAGVRHVAENAQQAQFHQFDELGHLGPLVDPEPVATELGRFFSDINSIA